MKARAAAARRADSLSPIGGEGGVRGQVACVGTRLVMDPGYPLIPTFSPKGEKESDESCDSRAPSFVNLTKPTIRPTTR